MTAVETQQFTQPDQFGFHVAMSATLLLVSAHTFNHGATFVYMRASSTSDYVFKESLVPTTHSRGGAAWYGVSAAICSPSTVVVGAARRDYSQNGLRATSSGAVHVFDLVSGNFTEHPSSPLWNTNPGQADFFGRSMACTATILAVGAPSDDHDIDPSEQDVGSVSILRRDQDGNFTRVTKLLGTTPEGEIGGSLAINALNVIVTALKTSNERGVLQVIEQISATAFNTTRTVLTSGGSSSTGSLGVAVSEHNVMVAGAPQEGSSTTGSTFVFHP